jgi:hypothetical protein
MLYYLSYEAIDYQVFISLWTISHGLKDNGIGSQGITTMSTMQR